MLLADTFSMFHSYGLAIGIGILVGIAVAKYHAKRWKFPPAVIEEAVVWILIPALVGARVYHLLTDWQLYTGESFVSLIAIWEGGLGVFGAFAGGILGLIFFVGRHTIVSSKNVSKTQEFFTLLDVLALGAPFVQVIGRLGNYFNKELYGLPTTLPWAILIEGRTYHPLFLYESLLMLGVGLFVWFLSQRKLLVLGKGQYAMVYLSLYGWVRFWLEFLRLESARFPGIFSFFSIAQWVSLVMVSAALIIFWTRRHAVGVKHGKEWDFTLS